MRSFAFYGKGGIGKSTITSHLSAAQSILGKRVLQVGCDPKSDSVKMLTQGQPPESVMDCFKRLGSNKLIRVNDIIKEGFNGVSCCESGGPEPGEGCAGRGVIKSFEIINGLLSFDQFDCVHFDVLGDVVCGGFAMPIHLGYAENVIIVLSGEAMALYAANNIMKAVQKFSKSTPVKLCGVILNCRNVRYESQIVELFCRNTQSNLIGVIPKSEKFNECDNSNKMLFELYPDSLEAGSFINLVSRIEQLTPTIPVPLNDSDFNALFNQDWQCNSV